MYIYISNVLLHYRFGSFIGRMMFNVFTLYKCSFVGFEESIGFWESQILESIFIVLEILVVEHFISI